MTTASRLAALALSRPPRTPPTQGRINTIDLARGAAVSLMILNHGVKGLLDFEQFPDWGLVPVHMATRFASSLFFMVFGIALAVAFLPRVHTPDWPRLRLKLVLTGVLIFFWYKVLTVAEMLVFTPEQTLAALLHQSSPSFAEILGFYGLALLWVPFLLPLWSRLPLAVRALLPALLALAAIWLAGNFHFWGSLSLRALLVEHPDYYTWGQLTRGPLVLIGLLIGEAIARYFWITRARLLLAGALALVSAALLLVYLWLSLPDVHEQLRAIAFNQGKHPPEHGFMLFSMGGAFGILSLALLGGEPLAALLRPMTVIGTNALQAFIFHIAVIFVVFRYLLGYWHDITYHSALILTACLILATAIWIKLVAFFRAHT